MHFVLPILKMNSDHTFSMYNIFFESCTTTSEIRNSAVAARQKIIFLTQLHARLRDFKKDREHFSCSKFSSRARGIKAHLLMKLWFCTIRRFENVAHSMRYFSTVNRIELQRRCKKKPALKMKFGFCAAQWRFQISCRDFQFNRKKSFVTLKKRLHAMHNLLQLKAGKNIGVHAFYLRRPRGDLTTEKPSVKIRKLS